MPRGALAILGCGRIAGRHAAAARQLGIPLVVASRDPARARDFARRFGAGAAADYAEAVGGAGVVGAIVCTPHDRHVRDVELALAAGRHVLVEKPLAPTLAEADRLIAAAARAGRVLMVAEQFHFMPAFRRVAALLGSGALGDLREIRLSARGWHQPAGWRLGLATAGGGALIDGGIHYVHNLRCWAGGVRRVFALRTPPTNPALEGEDAITLLAELAGGAVGALANSLSAPGAPRWQSGVVTGTRASCYVDNRGRWTALRRPGRRTRLSLHLRDRRGYRAMLAAFEAAMARGAAGEMSGEDGRADLAVVLAAYRSLVDRRPVEVAAC